MEELTKKSKAIIFVIRLGIGWVMFFAGITKILAQNWTAAGYLKTVNGPLASWFQSLAGNSFIDVLNMWGLTFIGIALILGLFVRFAAFWGIILMITYYLSAFPPKTGVVDDHIIYALVFLFMAVIGGGKFKGLDALVSRFAEGKKWLKLISS